MLWIEHREGEAIPDCLLYDDYQTDKNNRAETPLMCWIKYRSEQPIPEQLYYEGYQTDRDKWD